MSVREIPEGYLEDGLPASGFVRIEVILGSKRRKTKGLLPISHSAWYRGVKQGKYLTGIKLDGMTIYPVDEVRQLLASIGRVTSV